MIVQNVRITNCMDVGLQTVYECHLEKRGSRKLEGCTKEESSSLEALIWTNREVEIGARPLAAMGADGTVMALRRRDRTRAASGSGQGRQKALKNVISEKMWIERESKHPDRNLT